MDMLSQEDLRVLLLEKFRVLLNLQPGVEWRVGLEVALRELWAN